MTYKLTIEDRKRLIEYICGRRDESYTATFDLITKQHEVFKKLVDGGDDWHSFHDWAYKKSGLTWDYNLVEWLFYDPEIFCKLVATWLEGRVK